MKNKHSKRLQRMRNLGYRITPQRQIVLDALVDHGGHATALEIVDLVWEKTPTINKATIYRILDFFCATHLVTKTEMGGNTFYEVVGEEPHHHLVCQGCGYMETFSNHHFDELVEHLLEDHGFKADLKHLAISGLCKGCQE